MKDAHNFIQSALSLKYPCHKFVGPTFGNLLITGDYLLIQINLEKSLQYFE